jgi:hypothetical protein
MSIKRPLVDGVIVFSVSLVVLVVVTWLWNLVFHKASSPDWETSFRFAIVFAVILPWMATRSAITK